MNKPDYGMPRNSEHQYGQPTDSDAANWRALTNLLREKAYNAMTPEEISEQFPDLRQIYRSIHDGHTQRARW
jgi:hypothetical protein